MQASEAEEEALGRAALLIRDADFLLIATGGHMRMNGVLGGWVGRLNFFSGTGLGISKYREIWANNRHADPQVPASAQIRAWPCIR
jgi:hypothetical protein